jgi:hypothetical protein
LEPAEANDQKTPGNRDALKVGYFWGRLALKEVPLASEEHRLAIKWQRLMLHFASGRIGTRPAMGDQNRGETDPNRR